MRRLGLLGAVAFSLLLGRVWWRASSSSPHRVTTMAWWQVRRPPSPFDRLVTTPPLEVMDYLARVNQRTGFDQVPRRAPPDVSFDADLEHALQTLPAVVQRRVRPWLLGVFVVEDLGGSGFTEAITDDKLQPAAAFVVLDRAVLDRPANAWASWKEQSPFSAGVSLALTATLEEAAENTRSAAIQYLLLHEFGHVLSLSQPLHPSWNVAPGQVTSPQAYPFFALTWEVGQDGRYHSIHDAAFPLRETVHYYAPPAARLPASSIPAAYAQLEESSFPSLYAATGPADDFADSFASYVHTQLMHRPWRVEFTALDGTRHVVDPCWGTPRCAARMAQLQSLLAP